MRITRADVGLAAVIFFIITGFTISSCDLELGEDDKGPGGISTGGGNTHRSGQNCNDCHNTKYSGTVYSNIRGDQKAIGVTVVVTETNGTQVTMVTDNSGNFWSSTGNPGGGYTSTINGNTTAMEAGQVNGGCSAGGCHGSTQAVIYTD